MASKKQEELRGLHRLSEEQVKALQDTRDSKDRWEKYRSDYLALRKKLETLPDKLTHDVLVPLGPLAFMPGKLVHSNEIMVLLGDDWFAERSAKQAREIVDRRVKAIDDQMKDLQEQWKLLDTRRDFTQQFMQDTEGSGDFFEIQEEYDDVKEKEWRKSHRARVLEERRSLGSSDVTTSAGDVTTGTDDVTEDDLMRRLDELELLEQIDEYQENRAKENLNPQNISEPVQDHTELGTEESDDEDDDDYSNSDSESESEDGGTASHVINFSHTPVTAAAEARDTGAGDTASSPSSIQSPSDIYRLFPPKPRSILKSSQSVDSGLSKTHHSHVRFPASVEKGSKTNGKVSKSRSKWTESADIVSSMEPRDDFEPELAFSGEVKERNVKVTEIAEPAPQTTKRVSKFKQQRMQQQGRR